jgi:hypothetical protein
LFCTFYFLVYRQHRRKCKVVDRMVTSITRIQSPLNSFLIKMLICYCRSQIFELCIFSKRSICYPHIMILLYVPVT